MHNEPVPRSRVFYKFIASEMIVLVLPVAIITLLVYHSFVGTLGQETGKLYQALLAQGMGEVEDRMAAYMRIAFQVADDETLRRDGISRNVSSARRGIAELKDYCALVSEVSEILLYYQGDDVVYASSGAYDPELLSTYVYRFEDLPGDRFLERLSSASRFDVIEARNVIVSPSPSERYLTILIPIPLNVPEKEATLAFLVKEDAFMSPFLGLSASAEAPVLALRPSGGIVAALVPEGRRETVARAADALAEGPADQSIGGVKSVVVRANSEITGWSYAAAVPTSVFYLPFAPIRNRMLVALLLVALIGSSLAYCLSYLNYNPLRLLKLFSEERAGSAEGEDEIASVRRAVDHLYATSRLINQRLEENDAAIRNSLLGDLVAGQLVDRAEYARRAEALDLPAAIDTGAVAVFRLGGSASEQRSNGRRIVERVEPLLSPYFPALGGVDEVEGGRAAFIFYLRPGDFDMLDSLLVDLRERLAQEGLPAISIGVGDPAAGIAEIGRSYEQALLASEHRLTRGETGVIFYAAIAEVGEGSVRYPRELMDELQVRLMQLDAEGAKEALGELICAMEERPMPLFLARIVCFDIITTILKTMEDLDRGSAPGRSVEYDGIERLMEFETVEELASLVRGFLDEAVQRIRKERAGRSDERAESFKAYIRENYCDKNFSTYLMADNFGISVSNLSHFFKARTGTSITDFVNELRMEEAKRLLRETKLPVQAIVERLGYLSVSSFIRKFRQAIGSTPGAYREFSGSQTDPS
jgi:AraC-type DNA-binding domain-containing proteins